MPEPVAGEIMQRGTQDPTARAIEDTECLVIRTVADTPMTILEWRLGAGESAALALAYAQGLEAIIDDLAGRKCAASLGIPVRGTLGTMLLAKKRAAIPKARPVIEDMMAAGLYLSTAVVNEALRRVGECS